MSPDLRNVTIVGVDSHSDAEKPRCEDLHYFLHLDFVYNCSFTFSHNYGYFCAPFFVCLAALLRVFHLFSSSATSPITQRCASTHAEDDGMKAVNAEDTAVETPEQDEAEMVEKIPSPPV